MKCLSVALAVVAACAGCHQGVTSTTTSAASSATVIGGPASDVQIVPVHHATPDEWKSALLATYTESKVKDLGDGTTEFMAEFKTDAHIPAVVGKRDGFRKLRFFKMNWSVVNPILQRSSVGVYISVPDNEQPLVFLRPYFHARSWIFFNELTVMVDGDVIFDQKLDQKNLNRQVEDGGVTEIGDILLGPSQLDSLRKINPKSNVVIRLTGEKGYITIPKNQAEQFRFDLVNAIGIYYKIDEALTDHIPPV
ncbi:hypothetical protein OKW38_001567 [Paraburkholderia sp. MM5496-R1]|uniref:hypothetical protein n=1 Tax=Paraburkholderia sp. MM5496-R1 TaxID=2991065 RepID=UPI003D1C46DB